jgi:hypothetical protein
MAHESKSTVVRLAAVLHAKRWDEWARLALPVSIVGRFEQNLKSNPVLSLKRQHFKTYSLVLWALARTMTLGGNGLMWSLNQHAADRAREMAKKILEANGFTISVDNNSRLGWDEHKHLDAKAGKIWWVPFSAKMRGYYAKSIAIDDVNFAPMDVLRYEVLPMLSMENTAVVAAMTPTEVDIDMVDFKISDKEESKHGNSVMQV